MNKQPEVRKRTKENLIEAFWKIYSKNMLYKITIKEITEMAGYNRSTFYEYFTDINDLLEYAETKLIDEMIEYLENTIKNLDSKEVIVKAAKAYEHYGYYLSILLGSKGDPAFAGKYKRAIKPLLLKELNMNEDDPSADILCEYSLGAIISCIIYWYDNNKQFPAEQLASLLHTLLTKGIVTMLKNNE